MLVRSEAPADTAQIAAVLEAAFPLHAESVLVRTLRENGRLMISLVAVEGVRLVGYIGFSPVTLDGEVIGLGLAPVAVKPGHQGHGIGGALITEGLKRATDSGVGLVVVLGDPLYYRRFGFTPASGSGLTDEYGGGDAFQVKVLRPRDQSLSGGVVKYAQEFESLDNEGAG